MNKKRKIILKICIVFGILFIPFIGWFSYNYASTWHFFNQMYGSRKFDSSLWIKEKEILEIGPTRLSERSSKVVYYRCGMYNDLVKNHLKKGMKIKEVIRMLGDTDLKSYCIDKKIKCLSYQLDGCSEWNEWLNRNRIEVCFNQKEEVITFGKGEFEGMHHTRYSHYICGGEDKVICCFENECWEAPRRIPLDKKGRTEVRQDKINYKQW